MAQPALGPGSFSPVSRRTALDWAGRMEEAFDRAARGAGGMVERDYVIGDHAVRLRLRRDRPSCRGWPCHCRTSWREGRWSRG